MKIRLTDIKVAALNARTVILLAHFVRIARTSDGADLRMQQSDIVKRVFKYAATVENPDLLVLFMRIRQSMVNQIRGNTKIAQAA